MEVLTTKTKLEERYNTEGYNTGCLIDYMIFDGRLNGEFRAYDFKVHPTEVKRTKLREHKIYKDGRVAVDLMLSKYTPMQMAEIARNLGVELIPIEVKLHENKNKCEAINSDIAELDADIANINSKRNSLLSNLDELGNEMDDLISISGKSKYEVYRELGAI